MAHAARQCIAQTADERTTHYRKAGLVPADGYFDGIDTFLFHRLGDLNKLGRFRAGAQRHLIGTVELDDHRVGLAGTRADRAIWILQKPQALFERTALAVSAFIDIGVRNLKSSRAASRI